MSCSGVSVLFWSPCLSCPVSLHFLSLWLSALVLIGSSCVIASPALIVSTCVSFPCDQSSAPPCVFTMLVSFPSVASYSWVCVGVISSSCLTCFLERNKSAVETLLAVGSNLSLATTPWQIIIVNIPCVMIFSWYRIVNHSKGPWTSKLLLILPSVWYFYSKSCIDMSTKRYYIVLLVLLLKGSADWAFCDRYTI